MIEFIAVGCSFIVEVQIIDELLTRDNQLNYFDEGVKEEVVRVMFDTLNLLQKYFNYCKISINSDEIHKLFRPNITKAAEIASK